MPAMASQRILVVDDNLDGVQTLAVLLRVYGHVVQTAVNGHAALDIALKFRPQIVLLDIGLPGLNGFEVCARIRATPELAGARVIVITGYQGEDIRTRSIDAGCDLHLTKPVDLQNLLRTIG